jgi:hypothetical protein
VDPTLYWKFEASLNEAIERLIESYRANLDAKMVHVMGIDCGGAVARMLYTIALNDKWLRRHFNCIVAQKARPAWILVPFDLADLTRELLKIWLAPEIRIIPVPKMRQFHRWAFHFSSLLWIWQRTKASFSKTCSLSRNARAATPIDILCFAHNRKFIGLIRPIALKTGLTYAFVIQQSNQIDSLGICDQEAILLPQLEFQINNKYSASAWPDMENFARRVELALLKYRPKVLLYCEGDAWYQDVVSRVGEKYFIKSVCLQWGAFPYETPRTGLRQLACSEFFAWGDFFVEQLKPYNLSTSFFAVGHPGIELKTPTILSKRITFLLNTDPNGTVSGLDFFHEQFWELISWTAMNSDDWKLTVRPHPAIPLTAHERNLLDSFPNVEVHDPLRTSLTQSLTNCDLAVTVSSSSIIEAVAFGAVPLIVNPSSWNFQPEFGLHDAGFECKSLQSAIETVSALISSPIKLRAAQENLVRFRKRLFADAGDAVQAVIAKKILEKSILTAPRDINGSTTLGTKL